MEILCGNIQKNKGQNRCGASIITHANACDYERQRCILIQVKSKTDYSFSSTTENRKEAKASSANIARALHGFRALLSPVFGLEDGPHIGKRFLGKTVENTTVLYSTVENITNLKTSRKQNRATICFPFSFFEKKCFPNKVRPMKWRSGGRKWSEGGEVFVRFDMKLLLAVYTFRLKSSSLFSLLSPPAGVLKINGGGPRRRRRSISFSHISSFPI